LTSLRNTSVFYRTMRSGHARDLQEPTFEILYLIISDRSGHAVLQVTWARTSRDTRPDALDLVRIYDPLEDILILCILESVQHSSLRIW
jgi:hypothetical protein